MKRGWAGIHNMNHSEGSHSSSNQNHPSSSTQEWEERMIAIVDKMVANIRRQNVEHTSSNIVANQPTAVATKAGEENSSEGSKANSEPIPELKEAAHSATSALEKDSTEYPRIMRNVAATCNKGGDETMTTAPDVPLDELTEDQLNSSPDSSPSQEENKPLQLDMRKTVNDTNQLPGVSKPLKGIAEEHKLDGGIQSVEGLWFGKKHGVVQVSEELQTKSVSEEKTSSEPFSHDACSVFSSPEPSIALPENKVKVQTGQLEGICEEAFVVKTVRDPAYEDISDDSQMSEEAIAKTFLKNPEYEDISDDGQIKGMGEEAIALNIVGSPLYEDISEDDMSQPATKLPLPHTEESSFSAPLEQLQHTREDENSKTGNVSMERLSQVTKPNDKQSLKRGVSADEQGNEKKPATPKIETLDLKQLNCHSCFNESDDENHSFLRSSADLKYEVMDDHTDDDDDDDWIVIPLTISDLRFDQETENQEGLGIVKLDNGEADATEKKFNTNCTPWQGPEPTLAFSNIEVFETVDSFVQATEVQILNRFEVAYWSSPDHDVDYTKQLHVPENSREQLSEDEDSYDTEDSCDYPSEAKHNRLTVSRKLLEHSSVPPTPAADGPSSRNEVEDKVTSLKDGQTKSFYDFKEKIQQLIGKKTGFGQNKTCGQNISENVVLLELDPEGEIGQRRRKKAKRNRAFRSGSENSEDASLSQHGRNSPITHRKTEKPTILNNSPIIIDSDPEEGETERRMLINSPIIVVTDSEDEGEKNCKKKAKRYSSSGSEDNGYLICIDEPPPQRNEAPVPPANSQHLSNLPDTDNNEVMQDMCSDFTLSGSGQLSKATECFESVKHKANRQTDSEDTDEEVRKKHPRKKAANTKTVLPSTSEDNDDPSMARNHRPSPEPMNPLFVANKKSEKDRLSSEHSAKKQLQDGKAETTVRCNSVVPHLFSNGIEHNGHLELTRKAETQTPKNQTSCSKVCKKNERHLTGSKVQEKVANPPLVSRQFSLPNHVGPSTSNSSLSSTSGPLTDTRRSSASTSGLPLSGVSRHTLNSANLPRSEQSTSTLRHLTSSRVKRSRSLSSSSTIDPPSSPTIAPSSSGRKKVLEIWSNEHIVTQFRKRGYGKDVLRTRNDDSLREGRSGSDQSESRREARPEPSHSGLSREARPESRHGKRARQTHSSLLNLAPLMKKSITDYKGVPKAKNREPAREQRGTVGENYKWSAERKPNKGPSRDGMQ
ncbi:uncharacterized protein LOC132956101 isoform X2 [Labrus mixtus]|nr:uncharacterized protein LOC132956101 isoform X2 [Labrus mixtus]